MNYEITLKKNSYIIFMGYQCFTILPDEEHLPQVNDGSILVGDGDKAWIINHDCEGTICVWEYSPQASESEDEPDYTFETYQELYNWYYNEGENISAV